jgi:U4/U6.U5 tri-snRNP-associated protein 1
LFFVDDELHNLNLTENAKHAAAVDLKKKGRQAGQYTGYDDDEFNPDGAMGAKRGVLSKYDEGFEGVKEDGFKLGDEAEISKKKKSTGEGDENGGASGEREKVKLSMEYTSKSSSRSSFLSLTMYSLTLPRGRAESFNTDYLQEGDAGFKKPKVGLLCLLRFSLPSLADLVLTPSVSDEEKEATSSNYYHFLSSRNRQRTQFKFERNGCRSTFYLSSSNRTYFPRLLEFDR